MSTLTTLDERAGTSIDTQHDVLNQAGLDFQVETIFAHTPEGEQTNNRLLRRTDTNQVLGPVGSKYHVVQNQDAFAPFHEVVKRIGATYETAGVLRDGATCWVTASMPHEFEVRGDQYQQRLVMLMHHAAFRSNSYFLFNRRVVCNNMLNSLERAGRDGFRVRHNSRVEELLKQVDGVLSSVTSEMQTFKRVASKLQQVKMNVDQAAGYATAFVRRFQAPENNKDNRLTTRENTRVEQLIELFQAGVGNQGDTRYDMMNAVTEYLDHHAVGVTRKNASAARAFMSNLHGMTGAQKRVAVRRLIETDPAARGSRAWYSTTN